MFVLITVLVLFSVSYTVALFVISRRRASDALPAPDRLFFVFVVPCLNEELVIERSLERLLALSTPRSAILVVDDGSDDDTASLVRRFPPERVWLLQRTLPDARRGKGSALNAAYRHLLHERQLPWSPEEIVVCVVDADGRLADNVLYEVAPYFRDPHVGAVQIGVRMYNAGANVLTRLQDLEFVTFTDIFQRARQQLGSVGLGGNGQFTRLAALQSLGETPWTDCLTEDLELGLRLRLAGWTNQFCSRTFVSQQAVLRLRPLVRQRTRWFQGHLQCWRQIGPILKARLPASTSFDLLFHLTSPALVLLVSPPTVAFMIGLVAAGVAVALGTPVHQLFGTSGQLLAVWYLLSFGLAPFYGFSYWLQARDVRLVRAIAYAHLFNLYSYIWLIAGWRAVGRILLRERNWAKTIRSAEA